MIGYVALAVRGRGACSLLDRHHGDESFGVVGFLDRSQQLLHLVDFLLCRIFLFLACRGVEKAVGEGGESVTSVAYGKAVQISSDQ